MLLIIICIMAIAHCGESFKKKNQDLPPVKLEEKVV